MIGRIISNVTGLNYAKKQDERQRDLIRAEGRIGGQIFGKTHDDHLRNFFCLDANTWVWHEEWTDQSGQRRIMNTRYDVRPDGILKSQNGQYSKLSKKEAQKLLKAAKMYEKNVRTQLYGLPS